MDGDTHPGPNDGPKVSMVEASRKAALLFESGQREDDVLRELTKMGVTSNIATRIVRDSHGRHKNANRIMGIFMLIFGLILIAVGIALSYWLSSVQSHYWVAVYGPVLAGLGMVGTSLAMILFGANSD